MIVSTPLPVQRTLKKLGTDLSRARRRRRMTQLSLAERIGVSPVTLRRMEDGNPAISVQNWAKALYVLGELERLDQLLDTSADTIGLVMADEQLPKRVRVSRRARTGPVAM